MAPAAVVLARNAVVCREALDWLRDLPAGSVDVFWSSPPYNLADRLRGGNSVQTGVKHTYAGGNGRGDGTLRSEDVYQREQEEILCEWFRALSDAGVAFYNHKVRIKDGRAISPLEWILKTPFTLIQEVVWDRGGTANVDDRRFLPVSERVYVLAKRSGYKLFNRDRTPDVIRLPRNPTTRAASGHPCPTHPGLVAACLRTVPPWKRERDLVADCYMGSGTTALVARALGMDYAGCDRSEEYVALARRNLSAPVQKEMLA